MHRHFFLLFPSSRPLHPAPCSLLLALPAPAWPSSLQGNYSDLLVILSAVYSDLRGDAAAAGQPGGDAGSADGGAQGFVRSTTKYWVRMSDVSTVKHHILQHLPVYQFGHSGGSGGKDFAGDAQLINSGGCRGVEGWRVGSVEGRAGERQAACLCRRAVGRPRHGVGLTWGCDGCTHTALRSPHLLLPLPLLLRPLCPAVPAVYLDNSSLELYHGRLDKRPNAIALRIRCGRWPSTVLPLLLLPLLLLLPPLLLPPLLLLLLLLVPAAASADHCLMPPVLLLRRAAGGMGLRTLGKCLWSARRTGRPGRCAGNRQPAANCFCFELLQ